MKTIGRYSFLILSGILCLMVACSERQPGTERADADSSRADSSGLKGRGKDGTDGEKTETPSGRTQLPTMATEAPDLWITLPKNFSVRGDSISGSDIIVISRTDDPFLTDSSAVPNGMFRIVVSDSTISLTPPDANVAERKALIGDYPSTWRYYTAVVPGGTTYYSYELSAPNFFAGVSPDKSMKGLHLHLYIAGKDMAVINQLIASAESISTRP